MSFRTGTGLKGAAILMGLALIASPWFTHASHAQSASDPSSLFIELPMSGAGQYCCAPHDVIRRIETNEQASQEVFGQLHFSSYASLGRQTGVFQSGALSDDTTGGIPTTLYYLGSVFPTQALANAAFDDGLQGARSHTNSIPSECASSTPNQTISGCREISSKQGPDGSDVRYDVVAVNNCLVENAVLFPDINDRRLGPEVSQRIEYLDENAVNTARTSPICRPASVGPPPTAVVSPTTAPPVGTPLPSPPPAPATTTIPKTTVVLGPPALRHLSHAGRLDPRAPNLTLVFNNPNWKLRHLRRGDVIVAGVTPSTPTGLMRRITAIHRSPHSLVVYAASANLADVFADKPYSIIDSFAQPLSLPVKDVAVPGLAGVTVSGKMSFVFHIYLDVQHNEPTDYFQTMVTVEQHGHLSLSVTPAAAEVKGSIPIGPPQGIPVAILGVPIGLLTFHFDVTLEAGTGPTFTVGFQEDSNSSFGATGQSQSSWLPCLGSSCRIWDGSEWVTGRDGVPTMTPNQPRVSSGTKETLAFGPHVTFLIGGVAGPDLGIEGFVTAIAPSDGSWTFDGGIWLPFGAEVKVFKLDISTTFLYIHTWPLFHITNQPTATPIQPPTAPKNLRVSPSSSGGPVLDTIYDLDWDASTGNVSGYRLYIQSFQFGTSKTDEQTLPSSPTHARYEVLDSGFVPPPDRICFWVTAFNTYGESGPSNTVCDPS